MAYHQPPCKSLLHLMLIILASFLPTLHATCQERFSTFESNQRYSSRKKGNIMMQSLMSATDGEPCKRITTDGLIRVHAVKYAIETWNNSVQDFTVGYQIDDTCLSLPITMERGIEIVSNQRKRSCLKNYMNASSCTAVSANNDTSIVAVIGAYFSFNTIPLSSLLSAYLIPQLSYGASSPLLSKRSEFKTTYRSIPSDENAVVAMIDVIKNFGWNYIFAVGSNDEYGKDGIRLLKKYAADNGICFTGEMYIPFGTTETPKIARDIVKAMEKEENATVVVMFNYALKMGEHILLEAEKRNLRRIYLTSEAWNPEALSSKIIPEKQLESILTISLDYGKSDQGFLDYMNKTVLTNYECDIWLHQFIKQNFGCTVSSRGKDFLLGVDVSKQNCNISISMIQDLIMNENPNQMNNLIDLVDSVMFAIDSVVSKECPVKSEKCQKQISPAQINAALQNTNFTTRQNRSFAYDNNGNPKYISYSLEQIQFDSILKRYNYKPLGYWKSRNLPRLFIDKDKIKIPFWSNEIPPSSCSIDCVPGQRMVARQRCCWQCEACKTNTISNKTNSAECLQCPAGYHTKDKMECELTPIYHVSISGGIGVATTFLSVFGVLLTLIALVVIYMYREASAIKSFSKVFLLSSTVLLLLTFIYTFLHFVTPTTFICRLKNTYYHMMLTLFSMILLMKNNSVAHFISKFVSKKKSTIIAEIFLAIAIILPEIGIIIAWQLEESFPITKLYTEYEYFEECEVKFTSLRMLAFAFPFVIIVIASIQSLSERHTKFEFGEYKYLHYTCVAFCIINIAHVITLNQVIGRYQVLVMLITTISYGYIFLGCMIVTKIFRAVTEPKRNNNTSEGVCNIGFKADTAT